MLFLVHFSILKYQFSFKDDKNDSIESDEENELLTKETSIMFNKQNTVVNIDQQNSNKNKKINIVK